MKKILVLLVAVLTMAVCSVCSATPGKVLDAEVGIVEKFLTAKEYKALEPLATAEFKKDFTEESFANFRKSFGVSTKSKLLSLNKYEEGDVLQYIVAFENNPNVMYAFLFEVKNEKPALNGVQFRVVNNEQSEPATK